MIGIILIILALIFVPDKFWEYVGGFLGIAGLVLLVWLICPLFGLHFDYWNVTSLLCNIWSVAGLIIVWLV